MPALALNHVNIRAPRELLDRLRDFYRDVIGLRDGFRPPFPAPGYWMYAGDRAAVHLYQAGPDEERQTGVQTTLDHFAFDCSGLAETEAALQRHGVAFRRSLVPATRQVQLFLRDPAGNQVELTFADAT